MKRLISVVFRKVARQNATSNARRSWFVEQTTGDEEPRFIVDDAHKAIQLESKEERAIFHRQNE